MSDNLSFGASYDDPEEVQLGIEIYTLSQNGFDYRRSKINLFPRY